MRVVDVGLAFPFLLLVMALARRARSHDAGDDPPHPRPHRLARNRADRPGEDDADPQPRLRHGRRARSARRRRGIMVRHVLPNVAGPLLVVATVSVAQMILAESVLSYLGAGIAPPTPTWGHMLFEGQDYFTTAPWISLAPGARHHGERARLQPARGGPARCARSAQAVSARGGARLAAFALARVATAGCSERAACADPDRASRRHDAARGGTLTLGDASATSARSTPRTSATASSPQILEPIFAGPRRLRPRRQDRPRSRRALDGLRGRHDVPLRPPRGRPLPRRRRGHRRRREALGRARAPSVARRTRSPPISRRSSATTTSSRSKAEHLDGVTVEGRYVVTFQLDKPDATFLLVLAMQPLRPVCKSAGTRYDDTWQPCGAGPFKLLPGGWDRGREITVVRHDGLLPARACPTSTPSAWSSTRT